MTTTEQTVRKQVRVKTSLERAFQVFTQDIERWWHPGHHIGEADLGRIVLEGRAGGRWYEVGVDGSVCDWGRVMVWEPPNRVVLAWQIDSNWKYDPGLLTEVEVLFTAEDSSLTRVDLEHRNLDRYGPEAGSMADQFNAPGGWQGLLDLFAQQAAA